MSRITQTFAKLKTQNKTAFISYVTSGYPTIEASDKLLHVLAQESDIIEIGMPFSDPMADGHIIAASHIQAIRNGQSLYGVLSQVDHFRKINDHTPIVLMGYFNPIFRYGVKQFVQDAKDCGVDGFIIVDLPMEHDADFKVFTDAQGIDIIRLITPTTPRKRALQILQLASGFVYYVSVKGVTGKQTATVESIEHNIRELKQLTNLPIAIGFGIKTPDSAASAAMYADAIVVGTAIVERASDTDLLSTFMSDIKKSILRIDKSATVAHIEDNINTSKTILVTGGAGYIGSHTLVSLLADDYDVVVLDNLSNSSKIAIQRVEQITGKKVVFIEGDINDRSLLDNVFQNYNINTVIHFAGLKAVGESGVKPIEYYYNNIAGTINLIDAMRRANIYNFIFSSSATVYGEGNVPFSEEQILLPSTNVYGRTKAVVEQFLQDLSKSEPKWSIVLLRYFNPVGAHVSGLIGEDPKGIPNNLVPFITQVAIGKLEQLSVFGDDYNTQDGTAKRDYIHVVDLASGHLKALQYLQHSSSGVHVFNLGTGHAVSVLEIIQAFEKVTDKSINYKITTRRAGDIAAVWADVSKAKNILEFKPQYNIEDMLRDSWNWQSKNPNGYTEV